MNKVDITARVLEMLHNNKQALRFTIEDAEASWWYFREGHANMRLTDAGDTAFTKVDLESYELPFYDVDRVKLGLPYGSLEMFKMLGKLPGPWYMPVKNHKQPTVRLYDGITASMITLYGSVENYLKTITEKK